MPTDDVTEPRATAPTVAAGTPQLDPACDHASATAAMSQPHDEAIMREQDGLRPDSIVLIPADGVPPLRCPDNVWALLVSVVECIGGADPERFGEVAYFAGSWVPDQTPADGDLVLRLSDPAHSGPTSESHTEKCDVEMLLAYEGRWQQVGRWCAVGADWPGMVAPAAAAFMSLHGSLVEATLREW